MVESIAPRCVRVVADDCQTFGDAYEYLMTMYAGNAGKSGGEFFTPQEVIDITELNADIAKIVARQSELRTEIDAIVADLERDNDDAK